MGNSSREAAVRRKQEVHPWVPPCPRNTAREIPNTNSYAAKVCKKSVLPTKTNALLKCRVQPTGHSAYMDTWGAKFPSQDRSVPVV